MAGLAMSEFLFVLGAGIVLYVMKAIPMLVARLPQTRLTTVIFDLLPVGLLTALLLPPVLLGGVQQPALEGALVVASVIVALVLSALTNRAAIAIAAGLALLAAAELL
jgi:branched-subunit amino acid transport protein